ncbi:hypothetical protein NW754_008019 [Fusarium falciforme]|nr:hypothetical protein NW754_008019 [Fusarium falciforme]
MAAAVGKYVSKLAGKRVLVIGGSSGVGFGVAEAALQNGASSVFISSSSQSKISSAIERLKSNNTSTKTEVQGFPCNLASFDTLNSEVEKLFSEVSKTGKLDHVVFTAGDQIAVGKLEDFYSRRSQAGWSRALLCAPGDRPAAPQEPQREHHLLIHHRHRWCSGARRQGLDGDAVVPWRHPRHDPRLGGRSGAHPRQRRGHGSHRHRDLGQGQGDGILGPRDGQDEGQDDYRCYRRR